MTPSPVTGGEEKCRCKKKVPGGIIYTDHTMNHCADCGEEIKMAYAEEDMLEKIENRVNSIMLNRTLGPSTQTCLIKTLCSELVREERSRVLNHPAVVGLVEAAKDLVNDIRCAKICTLQVGGECNCGANGNLREFGKALAVFESLVKESQ